MAAFDEYFSPSERLSLDKTFRFDDKLCGVSSQFIMKNPNQIPKKMTTDKFSDDPSVTLLWSDATETTLEKILGDLDDYRKNTSVFIIGRYNHLKPGKLREYRNRYRNLEIEYTTAHSSKGTERDYVIIVGLTSAGYAFPSQIVDDPVLELVLAKKERVPNAEERRLLYVALTRARKHVYLIVDERRPSVFASEIAGGEYEVIIEGNRGVGIGGCPVCKTGVILHRRGEYGEFYSCSNYPYCSYRPRKCPVCRVGVVIEGRVDYMCSKAGCNFRARKCPGCHDGYLVERRGPRSRFLGCSNYPECSHTESLGIRRR
jgi:DNA helicase-4